MFAYQENTPKSMVVYTKFFNEIAALTTWDVLLKKYYDNFGLRLCKRPHMMLSTLLMAKWQTYLLFLIGLL
jgi:hypothetical protein